MEFFVIFVRITLASVSATQTLQTNEEFDYFLSNERFSYDEALKTCENLSATLTIIKTKEVQMFLEKITNAIKIKQT